jgi:5-carboxyvanillate decarboxylase
MDTTRRDFLVKAVLTPAAAAAVVGGVAPPASAAATAVATEPVARPAEPQFDRICVEEAFAPQELLDVCRRGLDDNDPMELGFRRLMGGYFSGKPASNLLLKRLSDIGDFRLAEMDENRIRKQLLSITAPGVQHLSDKGEATAMARLTNDRMADAVRKHPDRFDALAACAPQDPQQAAREIERAVKQYRFKGALINSHTKGEYLDEEKFWPILEALNDLRVPLYLHPNTPAPQMIQPFLKHALDGPTWGFAADTSLHALRLVMGGIFDRFPNLKIVLGHSGEGLPLWLDRIDDRYAFFASHDDKGMVPRIRRKPSEYIHDHMYMTTSGQNFTQPAMFITQVMGSDNIMYAADYPYESMATRKAIDALPIADGDKRKMFAANAQRIFNLT